MNRDDRARVFLDVDAGRSSAPSRPEPDRPFCILVLGDFSGSAGRGTDDEGPCFGSSFMD